MQLNAATCCIDKLQISSLETNDFVLCLVLLICLQRQQCLGLLFYNELLHIFYRFRICDYKNISPHIDKLDAAMKADMKQMDRSSRRRPPGYNNSASVEYDRKSSADKIELAPYPIDGEWLPKSAVYALVDLMFVIFGRPKGHFKECLKRIQSGIQVILGRFQ